MNDFNLFDNKRYSHGSGVKGLYEIEAYTKQFSYKTYKEDVFKNVTKSIEV